MRDTDTTSTQLLRIPEVADRLRITRVHVYRLMNAGAFPYVRLQDGGHRRVRESDLLAYIEARAADTSPAA